MARQRQNRVPQVVTVLVFALCVFFMIRASLPQPPTVVVARIGNRVITQQELQYRLGKLPPYYRDIAQNNMKQFVEDMVKDELLYQEATARGLQRNKDVREILKEAEKKIVITRLIKELIDDTIVVSDDEIQAYYADYAHAFMTPAKTRVSHILFADEASAVSVLVRLRRGEDFEKLAQQYSIDITRERGGDIGFFTEGSLIPEFEKACMGLEVGALSEIIKTQFGYHIIKVTERLPAQPVSLAEVRDRIADIIWKEKKQKAFNELVENLRKHITVKVNDEVTQ